MSIEYMFFDNHPVTADMMNEAVSKIFTRGVVQIAENENDVPYNISHLNGMYYSNLSSGIVPETDNTLKVYLEDGKAVINDGTCIFPDGSHATVVNTENVNLLEEGTSFVSLCSDKVKNSVYAQVTDTEPTGNIVLLASITNGVVTDLRKYAKGKVASSYASDYGFAGMKEFVLTVEDEEIRFKLDYEPNFLIVLPMSLSETDDETITVIDMKADVGLSFYYDEEAPASYDDSHGKAASISNFKLNTHMSGGGIGPSYLNGKLTKVEDEYVLTVSISYAIAADKEYVKERILPCRRRFLFI